MRTINLVEQRISKPVTPDRLLATHLRRGVSRRHRWGSAADPVVVHPDAENAAAAANVVDFHFAAVGAGERVEPIGRRRLVAGFLCVLTHLVATIHRPALFSTGALSIFGMLWAPALARQLFTRSAHSVCPLRHTLQPCAAVQRHSGSVRSTADLTVARGGRPFDWLGSFLTAVRRRDEQRSHRHLVGGYSTDG
jgi:hypothetical protein